jgi:integrase
MPTKRLTAAMVERIKPPAKGQAEYWDKNMPGFGLRVSYRGTKAWTALTRLHGKLIRITLGEWPTMGLADAHQAATTAKRQAKSGIDPREVQRQLQSKADEARTLTFGAMADQFLERYAKPRLKPRTIEAYTAALKGERAQAWQDKPIASVTRRDVMALLDNLEAKGKHATAKLALAYLRKFFGWCAERDAIREVPTYRIRLNGMVKPRERALSLDELHQVWKAAGKIGGTGGALVKILILTGQRRHETSVMRWRDLAGLENGNALWSIPGEVTKNHRPHDVPLAPEAVAVIRSLPIITSKTDEGEHKSELVFTTTGTTPWSGFSKLKRQIDEQIAKAVADDGGEPMAPWTMHDLRRSLVTGMNDRGIAPPHIIEAIVNHISGHRGGIAGIYNRAVYMDERRRALEAWARLITSPAGEGNNVVPMRRDATGNGKPASAYD